MQVESLKKLPPGQAEVIRTREKNPIISSCLQDLGGLPGLTHLMPRLCVCDPCGSQQLLRHPKGACAELPALTWRGSKPSPAHQTPEHAQRKSGESGHGEPDTAGSLLPPASPTLGLIFFSAPQWRCTTEQSRMDSNSPGNRARNFPKSLWKTQEHPCFPLTMTIPLLGSQQQPSPAQPSPAEQGPPSSTSNQMCSLHRTTSVLLLQLHLSTPLLLFPSFTVVSLCCHTPSAPPGTHAGIQGYGGPATPPFSGASAEQAATREQAT